MHKESMEHMKLNIDKYLEPPAKILDVGSLNVKNRKGNYLGCYKTIVATEYEYIGVDLVEGSNVDFILKEPYNFPFGDESFEAVITGQCFEHVSNPFKLIIECARVMKKGGYFLGVAPYKWPEHKMPVDCWRILSDGWKSLFEEAGLKTVNCYMVDIDSLHGDSWGIALK